MSGSTTRRFPPPPHLVQLVTHALLLHSLLDVDALSAGLWYIAIDFQLFALLAILLWLGRYTGTAPLLALTLAAASLFWFNRNEGLDNWGIYFFGSYGLGVAAWWASDRRQLAIWLGVIASVTIAVLVLGFSRRSGLLESWPKSKVLAFLGRISYPVFLVHFPIYMVANALFVHFGLSTPGAAIFSILAAWTASIAVGTLFHHWVEGSAASRRIAGAFGRLLGKAPG